MALRHRLSACLLLLLSTVATVVRSESLVYDSPKLRQKISLNTPNVSWALRSHDGSISVPASVPGDVYNDLHGAGVIPDPIAEFNDVKTRWVSGYNWTYETKFFVNKSTIDSSTSVDLVLEGVDTIGHVTLNNQLVIANCNSHWLEYRVDVKHLLTVGLNNLSVVLSSPVLYARQAAESYVTKQGYPVPPDCPPDSYNGECYFNFIRKPAYSFSWDWGPAVPTLGLWRPVYLDVYSGLAIDYVKFSAFPSPQNGDEVRLWWAEVAVGIQFGNNGFAAEGGQVCIEAQIDGATETKVQCRDREPTSIDREKLHSMRQRTQDRDVVKESNFTVDVRFENILKPQLWWPNGYGSPAVYTLRVRVCLDGPACQQTDQWETRRVAFRRIDLLQKPVGSRLGQGLTFGLSVNGQSVFIKGSNFVPIGMSIAGASVENYDWLMRSAAAVGINMLRVWGGGTIERPEFYDLADQLGIMIWQDFPFACALYPTDDEFLTIVRSEVLATVRRLQHRASLAVWVGNNENEGALANRWWPLWANRTDRYYEDYRKLYMQVLRSAILAEDSTRPALLSSPSNGDATEWEGGVAQQPQSTLFGDVHFYSYTEDMWLPETTPLARLMSEFGFQSHPSLVTALSATADPRNIGVDTNFTLHREHQPNGTNIIQRHNARHFANQMPEWLSGVNDAAIASLLTSNYSVPPSELKQLTVRLATYAYQSYVSQIDQAEIYRRITNQHAVHRCRLRRASGITDEIVGLEGLSSGVMYWQLNDVWSAPTWSSIEVTGAWKAAHYYARRYHANERVVMVKTDDDFVTAAYFLDWNRQDDKSTSILVEFACYDVDSWTRLQRWTQTANWTSPNCPVELFQQSELVLLKRCGCTRASNCMLQAKILTSASAAETGLAQSEQYYFDVPKNFVRVQRPQLSINVTKTGSDRFRLDLASGTPLYGLHLQFICPTMAKAVLSDNAFHMTDASRAVELRIPGQEISANYVKQCLLIHYL